MKTENNWILRIRKLACEKWTFLLTKVSNLKVPYEKVDLNETIAK